jgi:hypothetical protein
MSLLTQFLVATVLIIGLVLLRMFADRCAVRHRLRKNQTEQREECISCALKTTQQNHVSPRQS